jgi:hypothetical protein
MPPKKIKTEDKLFQIFQDSEVYVAMKSIKGDLLNDSNATSSNAMFCGILMDEDAVYYYLGNGEEVTCAVQKSEVAAILERTMLDEQVLSQMIEVPEGTDFQ